MDTNELIMKGVELMLLGMGSVFLFLILLVFAMFLTARLVGAVERKLALSTPRTDTPASAAQPETDVLAVITAAVQRYRKSHRH